VKNEPIPNVLIGLKQILHSVNTFLADKELGGSQGSCGKPLAVEGLVADAYLVGGRLGTDAVYAEYLAFACHIYI